jgi:hypothetical protein
MTLSWAIVHPHVDAQALRVVRRRLVLLEAEAHLAHGLDLVEDLSKTASHRGAVGIETAGIRWSTACQRGDSSTRRCGLTHCCTPSRPISAT